MKEIYVTTQLEPHPQFVTAGQIAKIYNVTASVVRFWASKGKIPCLRFEGTVRFELAKVRSVIEGVGNRSSISVRLTDQLPEDDRDKLAQTEAIAAANRVLYSWTEFGATGPLAAVTPEIMPTPALATAAAVIRDAIADGRRGFSEVVGYAMDNTEGQEAQNEIWATLADIADGIPERPGVLAEAVEVIYRCYLIKLTNLDALNPMEASDPRLHYPMCSNLQGEQSSELSRPTQTKTSNIKRPA